MSKFRLKGNITDENVMLQLLNNLPEEYDVILDNHLSSSRENALTIKVICEKLNHGM